MRLARGEAAGMMTDPVFRRGHDDAWNGLEHFVLTAWSASERRAYSVGYSFGQWMKRRGEDRMPITRGGLPASETVAALIRCSLAGQLEVAA